MDLLEALRRAVEDLGDAASALEAMKDGEGLGYFLRERARKYRAVSNEWRRTDTDRATQELAAEEVERAA